MNLNIHRIEQFNRWIMDALKELRRLELFRSPFVRASVLRTVKSSVKVAFSYANSLNCKARKSLCLRVLNWIGADLLRLSKLDRSAA